jgi:hypothetical protein
VYGIIIGYGKPIDPGPPENLENPENLQDFALRDIVPSSQIIELGTVSPLYYFTCRPSEVFTLSSTNFEISAPSSQIIELGTMFPLLYISTF